MKKEYDGLKLYDLTDAQDIYVLLMKFTIYKSIANIPFCLLLDQKVDWDLMQEAYKVEVQRNDSMRQRFVKTRAGIKQYFLPELDVPKVEYKDFTGYTNEEMKAWLNEKASRTLKFYKGELYEVIFFTTPEGRSGIYLCVFHMAMDTYGMIVFLKDLVDVYAALKNGTEMPEPLAKFEDTLQRDYDYIGSEKEKKDDEYFKTFWENLPVVTYLGLDGGRVLERIRKKKHDPNYHAIGVFELFKNKTRLIVRHVNQEMTERWIDFAKEQKTTYQALLHLGMHLAITGINGCADCSDIVFTENRRVKKDELRCGGCRVHGQPVVSVLPKETKVKDALKQIEVNQWGHMKHADFPFAKQNEYGWKSQKLKQTESNGAFTYSLLPPGSVPTPAGFDCDLIILDSGRFMCNAMHTIFPNLKKGGMDFAYKNFISLFTEEDVNRYHDLTVKAVEAVIANPEGTIGDMFDAILQ